MLEEKTQELMVNMQAVLPLIVTNALSALGAIVILLIGLWLSGKADQLVVGMLSRTPHFDPTLKSFFGSLARYLILTVTLLAVLSQFGIQTTSLVAVIGAASLAVGLALQGTLSNLAAGIMLLIFRPFRVGHKVQVGSSVGTVKELSLFWTELVTDDKVVDPVGLRDRALIGVMTYSFARISAVVAMRVEDYYPNGKRWWVRLHEKGGKRHEMPAHHKLEAFLDEYLAAARIREDGKTPLFGSAAGKTGLLTDKPMNRIDAYRMVRRRTAEAGLKGKLGCHVFRATGITAYLEAGGTLENAQAMAAHESPRTTKLYDRTGDEITLDEVERIQI